MNKYTDLYKTLSDKELIRIILNQTNYRQDAIEAAKEEIEKRELSEEMIEIEIQKIEEEKKTVSKNDYLSIIKKFLKDILDSINPVQKEIQTTERIVRSLIVVMAFIFLYNLFTQFSYILFLFSYALFEGHIFGVVYIITFLILPFAVYFLWKRKAIGWMLSVIYISQILIGQFTSFLSDYVFFEQYVTDDGGFLTLFDEFFYPTPLTSYMTAFIFFGIIIYAFLKKPIRELYKIDLTKFLGSVGIGMLLVYLSFISI